VSLGNGFYAGGADDYPSSGEPWQPAQPKLKLELDVTYANGTSTQVVSDPTWQVATGPTTYNSPAAETYNALVARPGWTQAGGDTGWVNAAALPAPTGVLSAQLIPPVEETRAIKPVAVTEPIADTKVYQFPITTSGWTRITMQGTPGTAVAIDLFREAQLGRDRGERGQRHGRPDGHLHPRGKRPGDVRAEVRLEGLRVRGGDDQLLPVWGRGPVHPAAAHDPFNHRNRGAHGTGHVGQLHQLEQPAERISNRAGEHHPQQPVLLRQRHPGVREGRLDQRQRRLLGLGDG
jgi:hypothetical protein